MMRWFNLFESEGVELSGDLVKEQAKLGTWTGISV